MITLPVEKIGDDYSVAVTDGLLEERGGNVGDDLNWDLQTDGSIIVTKLHDQATASTGFQRSSSSFEECPDAVGAPIHDC